MNQNRIFVQIPAYRDRELLPTVADLIRTARHPDRLTVCIAWQYGADELPLERRLRRLGPVELLTIPAAESRGCNWARRQLQQRWTGEDYTLLLDSHHRFAPGWDETLVRLHEQLRQYGVEKPVLTGYLPPYDPIRDPEGRVHAVYRMALAERRHGLMFRLTGHAILDGQRLTAPLPARFASLHLLFAQGSFNDDVPSDPDIYFFADEVAIALRAFTRGYDLFHPHVVLGWHLYDRGTRRTHWGDHPRWREQQSWSLDRLAALYDGSLLGVYGVGNERTISDFRAETNAAIYQMAVAKKAGFAASRVVRRGVDRRFRASTVLYDGHLSNVAATLKEAVLSRLEDAVAQLGMPTIDVGAFEIQLTSHNDTEFFHRHTDAASQETASRAFTFVYYFHRTPRRFTGGEVAFFGKDGRVDVVEPTNDTLVLFDPRTEHEVRPIPARPGTSRTAGSPSTAGCTGDARLGRRAPSSTKRSSHPSRAGPGEPRHPSRNHAPTRPTCRACS